MISQQSMISQHCYVVNITFVNITEMGIYLLIDPVLPGLFYKQPAQKIRQ